MSEAGAMHVFWVQCQVRGPGVEKAFVFAFETAAESVADLAAHLSRGQIVAGNRLELTDDGRGGRLIRARTPCGLGAAGIVTIRDFDRPVWEPEG